MFETTKQDNLVSSVGKKTSKGLWHWMNVRNMDVLWEEGSQVENWTQGTSKVNGKCQVPEVRTSMSLVNGKKASMSEVEEMRGEGWVSSEVQQEATRKQWECYREGNWDSVYLCSLGCPWTSASQGFFSFSLSFLSSIALRIEPKFLCMIGTKALFYWTVSPDRCLFWDKISLNCPGWPGAHPVTHAGLGLAILLLWHPE